MIGHLLATTVVAGADCGADRGRNNPGGWDRAVAVVWQCQRRDRNSGWQQRSRAVAVAHGDGSGDGRARRWWWRELDSESGRRPGM